LKKADEGKAKAKKWNQDWEINIKMRL
jgi:hypothetical protein